MSFKISPSVRQAAAASAVRSLVSLKQSPPSGVRHLLNLIVIISEHIAHVDTDHPALVKVLAAKALDVGSIVILTPTYNLFFSCSTQYSSSLGSILALYYLLGDALVKILYC